MTPNELKLYSLPGMQKLFREKMGQYKRSDIGYVNGLGMGIMHGNGLMYFENGSSINPDFCADYIRLPLPIDPINPERGLIEMLDYPPSIHYNEYLASRWVVDTYDVVRIKIGTYYGVTPTEVLLRAIMHQEGIEE